MVAKANEGALRTARAIDAHVAARLRFARVNAGLSQDRLAADIGVSFQQVQKYESGANRVGAGRLYLLAAALGQPVTWFLDGLDAPPPAVERPRLTLEINRLFAGLTPEQQTSLLAIARICAAMDGGAGETAAAAAE